MSKARYLVLENGTVFKGKAFGSERDTIGEVVFTTGMTGYIETLSDPSYHNQIVTQTFPLIGNYGVAEDDFESALLHPNGYIVRQWCPSPSNFRSGGNIDELLKKYNIPGLYDIDTRALTRIIREAGVMNGAIVSDAASVSYEKIKAYKRTGSVEAVSCSERSDTGGDGRLVALWDFGTKDSIRAELTARGCRVVTFPWNAAAEEIISIRPQGVMLSNGPGDPTDNPGIISELEKLALYKIPTFGICLGHQLMALAMGARTEKMRFGHRGSNHPVRYLDTGRVYITSQNHGYTVMSDSLDPKRAKLSCSNANDGTCEGIDYAGMPAFTVQFHPEASAGPMDTSFLFDRFISMMEVSGNAAE